MEPLERFKKAVEYLKTLAEKPTNEGVSKLLKYKTLSYISDVIGGSKPITPFLLERMVEFSISPEWVNTGKGEMLTEPHEPPASQFNEDPAVYNKALPLGDVNVTLKDYIELWKLFYSKEEEKNKELISIIKDLAKGQNEIKEALKPIKEKTEAIEANSIAIKGQLVRVEHIIRSDDAEIMEGTDKTLGREVGTTAIKAGIVELALGAPDEDIDKNPSNDTVDNSGKERQKRKA